MNYLDCLGAVWWRKERRQTWQDDGKDRSFSRLVKLASEVHRLSSFSWARRKSCEECPVWEPIFYSTNAKRAGIMAARFIYYGAGGFHDAAVHASLIA